MRLAGHTRSLLSIARTLHRWVRVLAELDPARRERVARLADRIADTLARAAGAAEALTGDPGDRTASRSLLRELGRISGYLDTALSALEQHLDARKVASVKRRLEPLAGGGSSRPGPVLVGRARIDRLFVAEGYFRALADSLRA